MSDIQVWILGGIVSVAFSVFLLLFKSWLSKSDTLISAINELKITIVKQSEQLKVLFEMNNETKLIVRELEKRVGQLEKM